MQTPTPPDAIDRPRPVLLVSEPGVDGVFHYVRDLANYLHGLGWPVHLAYSSVRDCAALHEFAGRVQTWGGQTLDLRVGNSPGPADLTALWRLRRLALGTRAEIIHGHSSKAGVLARLLPVVGVSARYFYTPHAYYQVHGPASLKKWFYGVVERVFGRVGVTICTSNSEAQHALLNLHIAPRRVCAAPTGVDCERFRPAASAQEKQEAREKFSLPADVPLLGTVARLSDQKDPLNLYRAVLQAMQLDANFHFAHLGKGDLAGDIDKLLAAAPAGTRSRIHRIAASEDTPTFYRALDGFTLPSRYEGFALSALEALATGLPMILTDCPGNGDLNDVGFNDVRWCPVGDSDELAKAILRWLAVPATPNNHRDILAKKFNLQVAWSRIVACYDANLPSV